MACGLFVSKQQSRSTGETLNFGEEKHETPRSRILLLSSDCHRLSDYKSISQKQQKETKDSDAPSLRHGKTPFNHDLAAPQGLRHAARSIALTKGGLEKGEGHDDHLRRGG